MHQRQPPNSAVVPRLEGRRFRDDVSLLRDYDGIKAPLRAGLGCLMTAMAACVPLGVLALSVYVPHEHWLEYVLGVGAIASAGLPAWTLKTKLWKIPVQRRLDWRTQYNPQVATVSVLLKDADLGAVARAVHKAGLPIEYQRILGHIEPAEPRVQIAVAQSAHRAALSDEAFRDSVVSVIEPLNVWANVGGVEIRPGRRPAGLPAPTSG